MLTGRVALITGSTGTGMGRSIALTLAHRGADIVLNYGTERRAREAEASAQAVKDAIEQMGRRAIVVKADTRVEDDVKAMVAAANQAFGQVDILVNNAGGAWIVRDYTEIPFEEWKSVLAAEIDGAFLTMKYLLPGMRARAWGRIIHISMSGPLSTETMTGRAPDYLLGKAARSWMTTAFGLGEFDKGITVNCIEPGLTAHMELADALKAARGDLADWHRREESTAHDIAEIVAFLCSDAGRFISGSHLRLPTDVDF